jgi:hypothetical protein
MSPERGMGIWRRSGEPLVFFASRRGADTLPQKDARRHRGAADTKMLTGIDPGRLTDFLGSFADW